MPDAQIDLGSDPEFPQRPEPFGVNGVLHLFLAVAIIVERARPEEQALFHPFAVGRFPAAEVSDVFHAVDQKVTRGGVEGDEGRGLPAVHRPIVARADLEIVNLERASVGLKDPRAREIRVLAHFYAKTPRFVRFPREGNGKRRVGGGKTVGVGFAVLVFVRKKRPLGGRVRIDGAFRRV